jgi:hypothetical protein
MRRYRTVRNPLKHIRDIHIQDPIPWDSVNELSASTIQKLQPTMLVLEKKREGTI